MRITVLATALSLCLVGLCSAQHAQASIRKDTNIPAEGLGTALETLAKDYDFQVLYRTEIIKDRKTQGAVGSLTSDEALTKVLSATGLSYKYLDANTVTVFAQTAQTSNPAPSGFAPHDGDEPPKEGDKSSNSFRLAQVDQTPAGPQGVGNTDDQNSEKKKKADDLLQVVVVTGTHIQGSAPVGTSSRTIDRTEIETSGFTTTEQLIQSLPDNFRGGAAGASSDADFSSGRTSGANHTFGSGINLRGLGNTATLVLVNGHRVASSGSGYFTDISTIPLSAIDHIDVLSDGASAVYGSDAIAGVVNIVLKKSTDGIEIGARYASADSYSNPGGNLQWGRQWSDGGATLGADFAHQSALDASEREFTSTVQSPTSLVPSSNQTALTAAAFQQFGDRLEVHTDAQYTHKNVHGDLSANTATIGQVGEVNRWSASLGGSYQITSSWNVRYDATGGQGVETGILYYSGALNAGDSYTNSGGARQAAKFSDQNLTVSGDMVSLPAGSVKLAAGLAYRKESFSEYDYAIFSTDVSHTYVNRDAKSGYAELLIPLVSDQNRVPAITKLVLSAAVRHDDYSDFGGTTNPKFGISWHPIEELEFRGAYSRSFRAPATGNELVNSKRGTIDVSLFGFPSPDQTTTVPVAYLTGGKPNLQPETARNYTFGLEWKPKPGVMVSLNYFDIAYSKQLATPPLTFSDALSDPAQAGAVTKYPNSAALQAFVNSQIASGATYLDYTFGAFGPNPLASTVYVYDDRLQNLSQTRTSGFDLAIRLPFVVGVEKFESAIDATRIDKFDVNVTPGSPAFSEVNTVGYPARLRVRGQTTWIHGAFNATLAANFVNSYPDTSSTTKAEVASSTTFDAVARYHWPRDLDVSLSAINIFNRDPPYVADGTIGLFTGSHYDPANFSPIGRIVTLGIAKRW